MIIVWLRIHMRRLKKQFWITDKGLTVPTKELQVRVWLYRWKRISKSVAKIFAVASLRYS